MNELLSKSFSPTLLRVIQETLPVQVYVFDRKGNYLQMEGGGLARLGFKAGQLVGKNIFELFPNEEWTEYVRQAMAGQFVHRFVNFGDFPWETWYVPFRDDESGAELIASIVLDVTEAKRAERELAAQLELVKRQQQVISALSTPIIEVWDKVLTLPLFGVLDSQRAAHLMEDLLAQVSRKSARFAILDLTGVEAMDTSTAAHLIKLIQALRLLGAEGIITGIQPVVAQTMITLGVGMEVIVTRATLRDGLQYCISQMRDSAR